MREEQSKNKPATEVLGSGNVVVSSSFLLPFYRHYLHVVYDGVRSVHGEEIKALFKECMGESSSDRPPQPPTSDALWGRLEELLDDESRRVNEAWESFKRDYTATNEADCLAAMAPDDPRFMLSLRREKDIRRNIDGKLRLLMNRWPAAATVPEVPVAEDAAGG